MSSLSVFHFIPHNSTTSALSSQLQWPLLTILLKLSTHLILCRVMDFPEIPEHYTERSDRHLKLSLPKANIDLHPLPARGHPTKPSILFESLPLVRQHSLLVT